MEMDFPTVLVRDGAGFQLLVDAQATDPISLSLRRRDAWGKRWLKRLLRWPRPTQVPHFSLLQRLLKPGDRVLDLGAHIGLVSLAAAKIGCEVLAVEACPRNAALLRASARCNGFHRLRIVHAAIGDRTGTASFSPHGPFGHVYSPVTDMPRIEVPAVRGDDLLAEVGWERVDFIKLDVEGSEIAALRGLENLLTRAAAPPILYELNRATLEFYGQQPQELWDCLSQLGYQHQAVEPPHEVWRACPTPLPKHAPRDFLAVRAAGSPRHCAGISFRV